jgi:hypothetical protein
MQIIYIRKLRTNVRKNYKQLLTGSSFCKKYLPIGLSIPQIRRYHPIPCRKNQNSPADISGNES